MAENVTVLRIQLDEGKTQEQLQKLVLDIEATRKAQAALTAERKAGTKSDEDFAAESVKLQQQLASQRTEYNGLNKSLTLYQQSLQDNYKGTQAALTLANQQFQQTAGSQDLSTESAKVLSATIAELRGQLTKTDEANLLFVRSVGNYPKGESLEPLIKQLVLLQEVEKQLPVGSQQAIEAQKQIGFQFGKVNEAAAAAGLAQKDVTNKLADYGERLRPVSADLAKLTIAQDAAAASAGKDSQEYAKIGFAIGAARQEIAKVPAELAKVPTAGDAASKSILGAFQSTGLYSQSVERGTRFIGQFKTGLDVLKGGFKGVQAGEEAATEGSKVLKIGLAEIGIGLLIIAFTSLVSFFSQSAEGAKILGGVTSALGATFQVLTDIVVGTGKAIFQVLSGDFKGAGETVSKTFDNVGTKILDAAKNGYQVVAMEKELIKQRRELEVLDVQEQSRVAVLLRLSKERGKTSAEQLAALKEAGEIEASITQKNIEQQQKELGLIELKIKLKGSASKGDLLQQQADAQKAIAQSLASQDEQNAKIKVRQSVFLEEQRQRRLDDNKAYYEAAAAQAVVGTQREVNARVAVLEAERTKQLGAIGLTENQRRAIIENSEKAIRELRRSYAYSTLQQMAALEQLDLDRRIQLTKAGSEEELALQRRKLEVQRNLELAAVGLTVRQAQAIREQYYAASRKLEVDAIKARALAAYDAELAGVNAELTLVQKGTDEETALRREAIDTQLRKELAALDKRKDNAAQEALLRANAAKATNDVNYKAALDKLENFLRAQRNALDESYARGKISEKQYNDAVLVSDQLAAGSRLQLAKEFKQETAQLEQAATVARLNGIKAVSDKEREAQAKRVAQAQEVAEGLTSLFAEYAATQGETLADFGRKALIMLIDGVEKTVIAAQIKIIADSFASADSIASFGITGIAKSVGIIALVLAATEGLKSQLQSSTSQQYALGTVLDGPSHAQGGVQLYGRGAWWGEAEGGEAIINKRSTALFLPLLSQINQAGGGRALLPNLVTPHMALGGVPSALALDQMRGQAGQGIDYNQLARAMSRINIETKVSAIEKATNQKALINKVSND